MEGLQNFHRADPGSSHRPAWTVRTFIRRIFSLCRTSRQFDQSEFRIRQERFYTRGFLSCPYLYESTLSRLDYGEYQGQRNVVSIRDGINQFCVSISSFGDLHPFKLPPPCLWQMVQGHWNCKPKRLFIRLSQTLHILPVTSEMCHFIILQFAPYVSIPDPLTHDCDSSLLSLFYSTAIA